MNRKAQSAVEYLTTYGWMILVVSIVSSVAYTVIDTGCREEVSGFVGQEPSIAQFGTGEDFLGLGLENARTEVIFVDTITVTDVDTGGNTTVSINQSINPGGLDQVSLPMTEGGCNTYDFSINFNISTLPDEYSSGRITVEGDLVDVSPPPSLQSFTANY
ncbi:MAG: hypothetical protein R6V35_03035 [Candidatus Nanohaloarchaea archaeon]